MNSQTVGLATNDFTWLLFATVFMSWVAGLLICTPLRRMGWRSIFMSLYGLVWLAFGLELILRFPLLVRDILFFSNATLRLADIPPEIVNKSLLTLLLFWVCFSVSFRISNRRKLFRPAVSFDSMLGEVSYRIALPCVFLCSTCVYLSVEGFLPAALVTPVALIGALWVIPAISIWSDFWTQPVCGLKNLRLTHVLILIPGIVTVYLNPYRETILAVFLIPFLAALFAGRKPRLNWTMVGLMALVIGSTMLIQIYRIVLWSPLGAEQLRIEQLRWQADPTTGPWMDLVRRFHALDSLLMTEDLVPRVLPYSGEDLFTNSIVRGLVPRALYSGKEADDKSLEFDHSIWSYGEEYREGGAAIAPSMPGDLYHAGGTSFVIIGALMWGSFLGLTEGWKSGLRGVSQAIVMAIFALQTAGSIERDFGHVISTFLQTTIVLGALILILSVRAHWRFAPLVEASAGTAPWRPTPTGNDSL